MSELGKSVTKSAQFIAKIGEQVESMIELITTNLSNSFKNIDKYYYPAENWKSCTRYDQNDWVLSDYASLHRFEIKREKERPLTMEGFENYCFLNGIINDLGDYFSNKDNRYNEFTTICSRIRLIIRQDQIEGGMANIYNPSITQRLNGLADKQEVKQDITANVKTNIDYSNLSSDTLTDLINNSQKND